MAAGLEVLDQRLLLFVVGQIGGAIGLAVINTILDKRMDLHLERLRESTSRQDADYLTARAHYRSSAFDVSRFVLLSSRASVGGGPYVVEAAYPLAVPALRLAQSP